MEHFDLHVAHACAGTMSRQPPVPGSGLLTAMITQSSQWWNTDLRPMRVNNGPFTTARMRSACGGIATGLKIVALSLHRAGRWPRSILESILSRHASYLQQWT